MYGLTRSREAAGIALERDMAPYFKKTRRKHDSGFACMEIGYCLVEDGRVTEKIVIGENTDHVWAYDYGKVPIGAFSIDCTLDGYFRVFDLGRPTKFYWDNAMSSSVLSVRRPTTVTASIATGGSEAG